MSRTYSCPQCGMRVPEGTWENLCPRCLGRVTLKGEDSLESFSVDPVDGSETARRDESSCFSLPRSFDDYELLEEIARGGMGVVYRATHAKLGRVVAIKMLLAGHFASAAARERFQREARAAAGLHHPHIAAVFDSGEHAGQPYLVLEYLPGNHLGERVRERMFSAREAAVLLQKLAEAVQYAHAHGILHRDLKPSNILLDAEDEPRITDFGLAKL